MKKVTLFVLIVAALAPVLSAQVQQVVPTDRVTQSGNGTFLGPLSNATRRYQLLIDSGELTSLVGLPLSGISFRLLESAGSAFPAATLTYSDYDIFVGAGVDPSLRSFTFADNRVGAQTQVRDGALVIPAGSYPATETPRDFGSDINFDTTYLYTGGDLLVELVHSASDGSSATTDAMLASQPAAGYGTRFSGLWTANLASATGAQGNFAVLRLTSIPEPATTSIAIAALGLLATRRARRD